MSGISMNRDSVNQPAVYEVIDDIADKIKVQQNTSQNKEDVEVNSNICYASLSESMYSHPVFVSRLSQQ